ncbi:MAG: aa3-type cytochrome c oxidase subunit IV [Rhodobacteraceae bacterium]|nr:aa3-type cytochrome c oxidase subunit IV [Paracoccaceae bacterium]
MADHKPASSDIREHERTFAGFVRALSWAAGITVAILILVALLNA